MRHRSEFITLTEKVLRHVHHPFVPVWEDPWRCSQTTENRVETQLFCRSLFQKEKRILSEHQEIRDHLKLRAGQAARGDKVLPSRLSVAEYHTRLLLGEPKNHTLSEARSELDMQELRVESAATALQESGLQLHPQRMELYQANQLSDHS